MTDLSTKEGRAALQAAVKMDAPRLSERYTIPACLDRIEAQEAEIERLKTELTSYCVQREFESGGHFNGFFCDICLEVAQNPEDIQHGNDCLLSSHKILSETEGAEG